MRGSRTVLGEAKGEIPLVYLPLKIHIVLITSMLHFSGLLLAEAVMYHIGTGVGAEVGSWGNMIKIPPVLS